MIPLLILVLEILVLCNGNGRVILPTVKITSMNIESKIVARLARVQVTTQMKNYENRTLETEFSFQLPETAFISNFTMVIGGKTIKGIVKEKEKANKIYEDSKNKGLTTAQIKQDNKPDRFMKYFTTSANLAAKSKVIFILEYHEVLERRLGLYTQRVSFQPKQIGPELSFKAKIYDQEGIDRFSFVLPDSNQTDSSSTGLATVKASDTTRELYFIASVPYQQRFDQFLGMNGQIVISYDVEHRNNGGMILLQNNYFVHYIAPSGFEVLDKNIIFVIDVSGSMRGLKMEQTKLAMLAILNQLNPGDYFNILLFSNQVFEWKTEPMIATKTNLIDAEDFVDEKLQPVGSTNINDALLKGIDMLEMTGSLGGTRGNIIVFLTDGRPTAGVTRTKDIRQQVKYKNGHRFSLFSLGFGFDVDMPFLNALSWENGGFARRIYTENDASDQLKSFYKELQNPTLIDVKVTYENNAVDTQSLTQSSFPQYFQGSEIVIAGKHNIQTPLEWTARVRGIGSRRSLNASTQPLLFQKTDVASSVIEKIWAYIKINDLLKELTKTDNTVSKYALKNEILSLSLRYNFVTPLTSMVVSESFLSGETLEEGRGRRRVFKQTRRHQYLQNSKMASYNAPSHNFVSVRSDGKGHSQQVFAIARSESNRNQMTIKCMALISMLNLVFNVYHSFL